VEVGNPDGDSRALPLDVVSGQTLGRIEVIKAVTPDLDAQGIGGTVNLVSQSPFDLNKNRFARMSAQVGYQAATASIPMTGAQSRASRGVACPSTSSGRTTISSVSGWG
ncbi:hypothetical protein, partial [Klebsiella pneumoniae]|uniref:hypothetical protein n=1 Tax=Klebsiella pneumoniae TaxID=573 RepID=UPI000BC8E21D